MMCRVLGVSRSSYYRWIKNPINKREQKQMELSREIKDAYFDAKGRNGSPRLAKDLQASGVNISRTTVARHMKNIGLRSKLSKKFGVTTDASHNYNVVPNLLNRESNQEEPMKACVSDITCISCKVGFHYPTCVIDLFDRKRIGWSISDNLTAYGTVIPAIRMDNRNRPFKERMIFHSDRGIQYACKQTVNLLQHYRVQQSMSGEGNCWDNAVLKVSLNLSKPG